MEGVLALAKLVLIPVLPHVPQGAAEDAEEGELFEHLVGVLQPQLVVRKLVTICGRATAKPQGGEIARLSGPDAPANSELRAPYLEAAKTETPSTTALRG